MPQVRLAVIGATGTVADAVLWVCRHFPEQFSVEAIVARKNVDKMQQLCDEFQPRYIGLTDTEAAKAFPAGRYASTLFQGPEALEEVVRLDRIDHIVFASSGTMAIQALRTALNEGKDVSLANKESIVVGGPWVLPSIQRKGQLRPLDSEHNALWQCLREERTDQVADVFLTASGGPFRDDDRETLAQATPEMALRHPVWRMGGKISVDSATLMNKGLELLEAMRLFDLRADQVHALIHPDSLVHGIVTFIDGSSKMLYASPDMKQPCAVALGFPDRLPLSGTGYTVAFPEHLQLTFTPPDTDRFPCLALAQEACRREGPYPALLVGADEVAVDAFLQRRISLIEIPGIIEHVFNRHSGAAPESLDEALAILEWAKAEARKQVGQIL
ncbi:MAG: 1-deoxy-D-xylulose-5-phosphate reductoisomerase [Synergistales bacterium]|nr:1-deoxy-D-xylulose-5-phosphate reductoisomerase [Synergistales bacterium]